MFASDVTLIHRRNEFRGSDTLLQKVLKKPNITIKTPYEVIALEGDKKINSIKVKNNETNEVSYLYIDGLFLFIGSDPASDFVKDIIDIDGKGYIKVNEQMETNMKNIYAVGDVRVKDLRQIITACNDGAIAGQNIVDKNAY